MDNTNSAELMALPGLEALRLMVAGKFASPSIAATMGFTLVEVEHGFAAFEGEPSDRVLNPMGVVHGGWALTLIDSCTGCAGHTTLPPGVGYGTSKPK
jgi:acyl-coenzyme A thioesterase PaaI-like protein